MSHAREGDESLGRTRKDNGDSLGGDDGFSSGKDGFQVAAMAFTNYGALSSTFAQGGRWEQRACISRIATVGG